MKSTVVICAALLAAVLATSCDDDPTNPDLVTIAGVFVNINDASRGVGGLRMCTP